MRLVLKVYLCILGDLVEQVLDIFEQTTGGRVIFSVCDIGGVAQKDISAEMLQKIIGIMNSMGKELTGNC